MVRNLRWAAVAILAAGFGTVAGSAVPVGAVNPGPTQLPALSVKVENSCTGTKVKNLVVSAVLPGGVRRSPTITKKGGFTFQSLAPGTYLLSVSAPGYEALSDGTNPGVEVTVNPGPPQVPAGTTITEGLIGIIDLDPMSPPPVCKDPGPVGVNALAGIVDSAATGAKVKHLSVSITNAATGGEIQPGPIQKTGKFVDADLAAGTWALAVSAPGYVGFSGVEVTINPGPTQDIGTITLGTEVGVLLPAVQ
jgi:Carboxypeptidase regulatory-like domain